MEQHIVHTQDSKLDRTRNLPEYDVAKLLKPFFESLKVGSRILDLGAGTGLQAQEAVHRGMYVTAVDLTERPKNVDDRVQWIQQPLEQFVASLHPEHMFDAMLLQNIIHFFPKEYITHVLLPSLQRYLLSGGIIAIETMSAPPTPMLKKFQSFYSPDELAALLDGGVLLSEQEDTQRKEDDGSIRIFHHTRILVRHTE